MTGYSHSARITEEAPTPVVPVSVPFSTPQQYQGPFRSPQQYSSVPYQRSSAPPSPSVPYLILAEPRRPGTLDDSKKKKKAKSKAPRAPKAPPASRPPSSTGPILRTGMRAASGDIIKDLQVRGVSQTRKMPLCSRGLLTRRIVAGREQEADGRAEPYVESGCSRDDAAPRGAAHSATGPIPQRRLT